MSDDRVYQFLEQLDGLRKQYGDLTMIEVVGCFEMQKQLLVSEMAEAASYLEQEMEYAKTENEH